MNNTDKPLSQNDTKTFKPHTIRDYIIECIREHGETTSAELARGTGYSLHQIRGAITWLLRNDFIYRVVADQTKYGVK